MRKMKTGALVAGALFVIGCAKGTDPPEGSGNPGLGGTTEGPFGDGFAWCTEIEGALAYPEGEPEVPIWEPGNKPPRGCDCATPGQELLLQELDENDAFDDDRVIVGSGEPSTLRSLRDAIYGLTVDRCQARGEELTEPLVETDCDTVIDDGPTLYQEIFKDDTIECSTDVMETPTGGTGMEAPPPDEWSDHYRLADEIDCDITTVVTYDEACSITTAFFDDVWDTPLWLMDDSARLEYYDDATYGDTFRFQRVTSGDIAHELGFRTNDQTVEVNGNSLDSFDNAIKAHDAVRGATTFTVKIRRSGTLRTHWYELN